MKNTSRTIIYLAVFMVFMSVVLAGTPDVHALELDYPEIPTPTGPIDLNCLEIGSCEASIAMFIVVFYGASVWVGGIIAFMSLLYVGLTYILAGANPALRNKAKNRFVDIVWGLAILLLVNAILFTINPAIIQTLEDPDILTVQEGIGEYAFTGFTGREIEETPAGDGGGSGDSTCYDSCIADGKTPSECSAACSGTVDTGSCSDAQVPSGTDESYNPQGSSTAEIQNTVFQQLKDGLAAGGLSEAEVEDVANYFFTTVIPCESGWVPHAENPAGTNCMPVGLYQLEDNRYQDQGCVEGEYHRWHEWQCHTPHALEVFFTRNRWRYWECAKARW